MLKFQVCRTLQTDYMCARRCCFFLRKLHNYLFVCWDLFDIPGILIGSKPSTIKLNQFANLIEKLTLCKGGEGGEIRNQDDIPYLTFMLPRSTKI